MEMSAVDRVAFGVMARSSVLPHRMVVQAGALLALADGRSVRSTAKEFNTVPNTVTRWRDRYLVQGLAGVGVIAPGRGRKSWLPEGVTVGEIVRVTLEELPPGGTTHWSTRVLGERFGVGKDTIARVWQDHQLQPWRVEKFKLSTDPNFEAKLVDVVGLYLNPPARAAVFCFDEKPHCQALDRTQASLPMIPGRAGTMSHDYKRHGTTDLFAAMNVATGEVLVDCKKSHKGSDVLAFFKLLDLHVPRDLEVHVVLDNLSAHKCPGVKEWLAHPKRKRWHLHFIPTSSSWLNLVERWFAELTTKRLKHGVFTSVAMLEREMELWAENWNHDPKPFVWRKTAQDIITKISRGRASLDRANKSATDH